MDEYIKKADAVKLCENYSDHCFYDCDFIGASDFERLQNDIEELPTADVAEVVHGAWINGRRNNWKNNTYEEMCSVCGRYSQEYRRGYCPNCGAKMDVSKMEITTDGGKE